MSGGSYNYLCHQIEARGYLNLDDLESMRDRLRELAPDSPAAGRTADLYDALRAPVADGLTDVWRAVEWFDSGDFGEDDAKQAIAEYRSES